MRRSLLTRFLVTPALGMAAIGLAATVTLAQSADTPPVPEKLTLRQAITLAINYNPRHRDSLVSVQDSRSRRRSAGELRQAEWNSALVQTYGRDQDGNLNTQLGSSVDIAQPGGSTLSFIGTLPWVGDIKSGNLGAELAVPIVRGRGRTSSTRVSLDRADLNLRGQELNHFLNQQSLVQQVVSGYYNAIRARELVVVQQRDVEFTQQITNDTQKRLDAGLITEIEVTRAQQRLSSAQVQLINRTQNYQNALDDLVLLLGLPVGSFPELTDPVPYAPVNLDLEASIREALAKRSELEQFRIQRANAELDTLVARDNKRPRVSLTANIVDAGFSLVSGGGILKALTSIFGLRASVPVSKKTLEENIAQSERQLAILDHLERFQREQIVEEVRSLARAAEAAKRNLDLLTANLQIAQRSVQISQRLIEEGLRENRDLLEAQQEVTSTESSILDAKVNYLLTLVNLQRALGRDLLQQFDGKPLEAPERPLVALAGRKPGKAELSEKIDYGRLAYPVSLR